MIKIPNINIVQSSEYLKFKFVPLFLIKSFAMKLLLRKVAKILRGLKTDVKIKTVHSSVLHLIYSFEERFLVLCRHNELNV